MDEVLLEKYLKKLYDLCLLLSQTSNVLYLRWSIVAGLNLSQIGGFCRKLGEFTRKLESLGEYKRKWKSLMNLE